MTKLWTINLLAAALIPWSWLDPFGILSVCAFVTLSLMPVGLCAMFSSGFEVSACVFMVLVPMASHTLPAFLVGWLVVVIACPQQYNMRQGRIGHSTVHLRLEGQMLTDLHIPGWWPSAYLCVGIFEHSALNIDQPGNELCARLCCFLPLITFSSLAMEIKQSLDVIPLLIAAPARWTKTSAAGMLGSLISALALPTDEWVEDEWVQFTKSATLGLSVLGAWLAPWMAAGVAAAQQYCALDADEDLDADEHVGCRRVLHLFLDGLMPEFTSEPHGSPLLLLLPEALIEVRPVGVEPQSGQLLLSEALVEVRPLGVLVPQATNIIAARAGQTETLLGLLRAELPTTTIEPVPGPRSYARVKINMNDEALVKRTIRGIARARGVRRPTIATIERLFDSPRY